MNDIMRNERNLRSHPNVVSEGNQLNDEVIVTNLRHFQELKSAKESLLKTIDFYIKDVEKQLSLFKLAEAAVESALGKI